MDYTQGEGENKAKTELSLGLLILNFQQLTRMKLQRTSGRSPNGWLAGREEEAELPTMSKRLPQALMNLNTAIRISRLDAGPVLELARMKKPLVGSSSTCQRAAEHSVGGLVEQRMR